jgi:CheY-like chemotaxis protein
MSFALVIDDNRQTADALCQMLDFLNVPTRVAYGASSAISILGSITPRLILLDINMLGVDGFEILAYLRREPRLVPVPVVVITSDDQPETKARVMEGGAQALIIKPATLESLEAALKSASVVE